MKEKNNTLNGHQSVEDEKKRHDSRGNQTQTLMTTAKGSIGENVWWTGKRKPKTFIVAMVAPLAACGTLFRLSLVLSIRRLSLVDGSCLKSTDFF